MEGDDILEALTAELSEALQAREGAVLCGPSDRCRARHLSQLGVLSSTFARPGTTRALRLRRPTMDRALLLPVLRPVAQRAKPMG